MQKKELVVRAKTYLDKGFPVIALSDGSVFIDDERGRRFADKQQRNQGLNRYVFKPKK
jgi:hypothetical protein